MDLGSLLTGGSDKPYAPGLASSLQCGVHVDFIGSEIIARPTRFLV
jgi:hypothetical protein